MHNIDALIRIGRCAEALTLEARRHWQKIRHLAHYNYDESMYKHTWKALDLAATKVLAGLTADFLEDPAVFKTVLAGAATTEATIAELIVMMK